MIVDIVEKIINTANIAEDLCLYRLVSRTWNQMSCRRLKSVHKPIQFKDDVVLSNFLGCFEPSIRDSPFSKFHFQLDKTGLENLVRFFGQYIADVVELSFELRSKRISFEDLEKLQQIFDIIGSSRVRKLEVNISSSQMQVVNQDDEILSALSIPSSSLPNLRTLQFNREITSTKTTDDWRLTFLHSLKAAASNLEQVIISAWKGTPISRVSTILNIFKDASRIVIRNVTFLTYEPLDVQFLQSNNPGHVTELNIRLQYDFDKLGDDNSEFNYDEVRLAFATWLKLQALTLTSLIIVFEEVSEFYLPALESLETFELGLGTYNDVDLGNPLLPFDPAQFPKLRSVTLNFYSEDWGLFSSEAFHTVDSLRIQGYQEEFVNYRWELIFPNLKRLELACLKPLQLQCILLDMTTLEELKLELCHSPLEERPSPLRSLTRLTNLTSLSLTGCGSASLNDLTQMSQDGSLRPLRKLTIMNKIPPALLEQLKKVHDNVTSLRLTTPASRR